MFRRLRLIPFNHTVPPEKQIGDLAGRLVAEEGPGVLAWIVKGACRYLNSGLREPDSVATATTEYRVEEDHLGKFISDQVTLWIGRTEFQERQVVFRKAYEKWCADNRETPKNPIAFGRALKKLGIVATRSGQKYYIGVRLRRNEPSDEVRWDQG